MDLQLLNYFRPLVASWFFKISYWNIYSTHSFIVLLGWLKALPACQVASVWLCDLMDCSQPGSSVHGDSPGKNTGVGCCAILQGIFLTQGSNSSSSCLLHWRAGSLPLRRGNSSWEPKPGGQAGEPFLYLSWATIPGDNQCFPAPVTLSMVFPVPEMPFPAIFAW